MNNNELYHFGIKGQKWGVRKEYDKTSAGRQYKKNIQLARKEYMKAYDAYNMLATKKNKKKLNESERNYKHEKFKYSTDKEAYVISKTGKQFKNKSKYRLKLEEKYKKMGLSDEQAQAAANNRIRTEKILAATAGLTVAACAAYYANSKRKNRIDQVIKSGESLQRIEMQDTSGKLYDVFYASKGKHDNKRYEGLLGYTRKQQTGHAYMLKLEAQNDIKVASRKNAEKAFEELYKSDPEFRKSVEGSIKKHFGGGNIVLNTNDTSKRNISKMYENFNSALIDIRDKGTGADKKFYDKLKSAGYGAIQDVNDMKYSGYKAKNPLIVFDNSNNNIMVKSVNDITNEVSFGKALVEINKAKIENNIDTYLPYALSGAAAGATGATVYTYYYDPKDYSEKKKQIKIKEK